jgi:HlyD family secretion protein
MQRLTALVLGSAVIGAGVFVLTRSPPPIPVVAHTLSIGEVSSSVANTRVGTVKACRRAYLAPATGGQVARLHIKEGDTVQQGEVLLEVWNTDLQAQVQLQQAHIQANQSSAEQACQLAGGAARQAQRLTQLQQRPSIVSDESVDQSLTSSKAQRAACQAALQTITIAKAQLAVAEAALQRTRIVAPFDGTVAEINAELGEFVTPSPPGIPTLPAIDLLDVSCLTVSAPIDEVDAAAIKTGMTASISLDAFPAKRSPGIVSRIAPYVLEKEKQARTVEVEVTLTDRNDLTALLPGYSADIEIVLAQKAQALRVPAEAIIDGDKVLLIDADNTLLLRHFQAGLHNWNVTEALSGLQAGDRVTLSVGKAGVVDGARVQIQP